MSEARSPPEKSSRLRFRVSDVEGLADSVGEQESAPRVTVSAMAGGSTTRAPAPQRISPNIRPRCERSGHPKVEKGQRGLGHDHRCYGEHGRDRERPVRCGTRCDQPMRARRRAHGPRRQGPSSERPREISTRVSRATSAHRTTEATTTSESSDGRSLERSHQRNRHDRRKHARGFPAAARPSYPTSLRATPPAHRRCPPKAARPGHHGS